MSIAVTSIVRPSRTLNLLVSGMSLMTGAISFLAIAGHIGRLVHPWPFIIAVVCLAGSLLGLRSIFQNKKIWRIDISGTGQIRLTTYTGNNNSTTSIGDIVQLMPDSTLWSWILLLRFKQQDGAMTVLPILPDCLSDIAFREVSIACRWIARHGYAGQPKTL